MKPKAGPWVRKIDAVQQTRLKALARGSLGHEVIICRCSTFSAFCAMLA